MEVIIAIIVLGAVFWFIYIVARLIWRALGGSQTPQAGAQKRHNTQADTGMTAEEEGNVHSGPYGYSPNTAYPETQYGSLFDPDAEWNHEEQ